jgi:hypothetical protein
MNISQMLAALTYQNLEKDTQVDWRMDLLRHFLDSLEFSKKAFDANPEWTIYREGQEILKKNISSFIGQDKTSWEKYLIEFDDNSELRKIMKTVDIDTYNKLSAKLHIEEDSLKKLYFTGFFWLLVLGIVFVFVISLLQSAIPLWSIPIAAILALTLFSVIGAFILRTIGVISEKGFLELMKLSLTIGIKGVRVLDTNPDE